MITPLQAINPENVADPLSPHSEDRPMTAEQAAILNKLCRELDEPMDSNLSEAQAARRIAGLKELKAN